jgi:MarR family transcriptional regulator, transcriptional regulator for hemolysin
MGMHTPPAEPIGLQVINAARLVSDALDVALTAAGGSLGMWRILVAVSGTEQRHRAHSEFSEAMGVGANTLSDDIHRMEVAGLVVRNPDPPHSHDPGVELTDAGRALFHRLLRVVVAFDARLRTGLAAEEMEVLSSLLTRLRSNVASTELST